MQDSVRSDRIVELDGLRGLAILLVVAAHYFGEVSHGITVLGLGWIGVDLFFVLSGFLIGGILLDHQDCQNYFSAFYVRRALRIFPIYYVVVSLTLGFSALLSIQDWIGSYLPASAYFTYTQNITIVLLGRIDSQLLHPTWTLAVEEQFYLIIPLFIYLCPKRHFVKSMVIGIFLAPLFRSLFLYHSSLHEVGAAILLPCRWDALLLGVLAAFAHRNARMRALVLAYNGRIKAVAVACLMSVPISLAIDIATRLGLFVIIGQLTLSMFFALFFLLIVNGAEEGRHFRSSFLGFFGKISYCLYLVHQPIAGFMHGLLLREVPDVGTIAQFSITLSSLGLSIAIATLSWTYFEAQLIAFGHRWRYRKEAAPDMGPARELVA